MLVLDHLFLCVPPARGYLTRLRAAGFRSEFSREHTGQGTANDLVLFPGNYLELLYMTDRVEAERALVRLHRRCEHTSSGASPFGIALRGQRHELVGVSWTPYRLEGMATALHIVTETLEDDRLPMVFCFDSDAPARGGPRTWNIDAKHFDHACGATGIASARLAGPGYGELAAWELPGTIEVDAAETASMRVTFDSVHFAERSVNELLTLA